MNGRSKAIDALRGIAALSVVVYHSREINWVGLSSIWQKHGLSADLNALLGYASAPFSFGFVAVPLFFVISGYCIHRPNVIRLQGDPDHSLNLGEYCKRRLWRVYPVLIAALFLTLLLDSYTRAHTPEDYRLGDNSWQSFVLNLLTLQNIACPPYGSNGPLWTLGMELHFYFLYPLLFHSTKKVGAAKTVTSVFFISVVCIAWLKITGSQATVFPTYWFTWATGFLIAECDAGRCTFRLPKPLLASILLTAVGCGLCLKNERHLAEPFFAVGFGSFVWWSLRPGNRALWESPLGRMAAFLGIFSYSLYAIHLPFLVFLKSSLQGGAKAESIAVPLVFSLFSVLLAAAMFWAVERWSLRLPGKSTPPRTEKLDATSQV